MAWNNTSKPHLEGEYIRHFTGSMRQAFTPTPTGAAARCVARLVSKAGGLLDRPVPISQRVAALVHSYGPKLRSAGMMSWACSIARGLVPYMQGSHAFGRTFDLVP
jgi:hypothetical protein